MGESFYVWETTAEKTFSKPEIINLLNILIQDAQPTWKGASAFHQQLVRIVEESDQPSINEITVTKWKGGRPTVINWNNERWVLDTQTTFRGGVKRGQGNAQKKTP